MFWCGGFVLAGCSLARSLTFVTDEQLKTTSSSWTRPTRPLCLYSSLSIPYSTYRVSNPKHVQAPCTSVPPPTTHNPPTLTYSTNLPSTFPPQTQTTTACIRNSPSSNSPPLLGNPMFKSSNRSLSDFSRVLYVSLCDSSPD